MYICTVFIATFLFLTSYKIDVINSRNRIKFRLVIYIVTMRCTKSNFISLGLTKPSPRDFFIMDKQEKRKKKGYHIRLKFNKHF